MKILNYTEEVNSVIDDLKIRQNEYPLPAHPARILIIGPSGSGKSNLVLNLLFGGDGFPSLNYDKIYWFLRDVQEDKMMYVVNRISRVERRIKNTTKQDVKLLEYSTNLDEVPSLEDIDKDIMNLVVFDDCVAQKHQEKISELFLAGRKRNCTIIYITQSLFRTPMLVREQCTHLAIFRTQRNDEPRLLADRYASGISKEQFLQYYEHCISQSYGFLYVDLAEKTPKFLRYRCGLSGVFTSNKNRDQ